MLALLLAAAVDASAQGTPAQAGESPEAVYLKLHRATLAGNLPEMMLYATEERKAELTGFVGDPIRLKLVSSMMPRVYTVRSLALSADGTRARMRATGNFTFMHSTAPSFGVVDLAREDGGWKVERFEWAGDKPAGWDAAVAQSPVRRGASGALEKVPPPEAKPPVAEKLDVLPPAPGPVAAPVMASPAPGTLERSRNRGPCEIKPVMSDEDLSNCGATPQ